jgi:tetratricopeptide (TPR) repeat protein
MLKSAWSCRAARVFVCLTTVAALQGAVYVRGKVLLSDGQPPPDKVEIELVCQAQVQPQGKTDSKGGFVLELGADRFQGASNAGASAPGGASLGGALSGQTQTVGGSVMSLMGCSLRGALRGYVSESADLSRVRAGDTNDVGAIIMRRFAETPAGTVSVTSLSAPSDARKAFRNAQEHVAAKRPAEAEKEFARAVKLYPKYAEAWQEWGSVALALNRPAEARKVFLQSIASDAAFAKPYLSLTRLSAVEKNWQDVVEKAGALLQLNSPESAQAYYYRAVAYYNLDNNDKAFDDAQQAVKLDTAHTVPLAEQMLGVLFSMRGDHKAAAEQFRNYIQHVPPTTNLTAVKALLAEAESRAAQSGR